MSSPCFVALSDDPSRRDDQGNCSAWSSTGSFNARQGPERKARAVTLSLSDLRDDADESPPLAVRPPRGRRSRIRTKSAGAAGASALPSDRLGTMDSKRAQRVLANRQVRLSLDGLCLPGCVDLPWHSLRNITSPHRDAFWMEPQSVYMIHDTNQTS